MNRQKEAKKINERGEKRRHDDKTKGGSHS